MASRHDRLRAVSKDRADAVSFCRLRANGRAYLVRLLVPHRNARLLRARGSKPLVHARLCIWLRARLDIRIPPGCVAVRCRGSDLDGSRLTPLATREDCRRPSVTVRRLGGAFFFAAGRQPDGLLSAAMLKLMAIEIRSRVAAIRAYTVRKPAREDDEHAGPRRKPLRLAEGHAIGPGERQLRRVHDRRDAARVLDLEFAAERRIGPTPPSST